MMTTLQANRAQYRPILIVAIALIFTLSKLYAGEPRISWNTVGVNTIEGTRATAIAEGKNGAILLGSINGVYRSTDKGIRWQKVSTGLPTWKPVYAMCTARNGVAYVSIDGKIYRSFDNGDSWVNITGTIKENPIVFLNTAKDGRVFAGVWGAVYVSSDSGATWATYGSTIPRDTNGIIKNNSFIGFGKYNRILCNVGNGTYLSTNNGSSWTIYKKGTFPRFCVMSDSTDYIGIDGELYINKPDGIYYAGSQDAGNYPYLRHLGLLFETQLLPGYSGNPQIATYAPYSLSFVELPDKTIINSMICYGLDSLDFNSGSTPGTYNHQKNVNTGLDYPCVSVMLRHSDGSIYAGTWGGAVYRSTNNCKSWTGYTSGLKEPYIHFIDNEPTTRTLYASAGSGFFRSSNGGKQWENFSTGLKNVLVYRIVRTSKGTLFALTWDGLYSRESTATSWSKIVFDRVDERMFFNDLCIGKNDTLAVAVQGTGIYFSYDNGKKWEVTYANNKLAVAVSCYYSSVRQRWYLGTTSGITASISGVRTWYEYVNPNRFSGEATFMIEDADAKFYYESPKGIYEFNDATTPPEFTSILGSSPYKCNYARTNLFSQFWRAERRGVLWRWEQTTDWQGYGDTIDIEPAAIALDNDGYVYVGTHGKGILKSSVSSNVLNPPDNTNPKKSGENVNFVSETFGWSRAVSGRGYHIQISTDSSMKNLVVNDSLIRTNYRLIRNLSSNTRYYWRLRTMHKQYRSAWSEVWTFKTGAQLPAKLKLTSPPNNSIAQPTTLALEWQGDVNAEKYHLQVRKTSDQTIVVDDTTLTALTRSFIGTPKTSYSWQVRAIGALGAGAWSDAWQFTTEENTSVASSDEEGGIVIIPNPLSEWFQIQLPTDKEVSTVTLTDIRGVEVYRGTELRVQTSSIPNGVYVVSVRMKGSESTPLRRLISIVR